MIVITIIFMGITVGAESYPLSINDAKIPLQS